MPYFGRRSRTQQKTLHFKLQDILNEAIKLYDFSILEGFRGKDRQNEMVKKGTSKLRWPKSNHNTKPSLAVDCVPYFKKKPHYRWKDLNSFYHMSAVILGVACRQGIRLEWGGLWKKFKDYPHFELKL